MAAQKPPRDLSFAPITATPNSDPIESRSPAVGQLSVSDRDQEMHDQNYPYKKTTAFKSSMDETWTPTPAPLPSNHHWNIPATKAPKMKSHPEKILAPQESNTGYVAIDPFVPSVAKSAANFTYSSKLPIMQPQVQPTIDEMMPPGAHGVTTLPTSSYIVAFLLDTLPRQIYLYFLLTLPSLYFSRVARIFEDAELSMPDIKRMVISSPNGFEDQFPSATRILGTWKTPNYSAPSPFNFQVVARFKTSWEQFVDSLMEEWKTLNLVSVLLLSAILTTLQLDGAVTDPYTRYFAFLALVYHILLDLRNDLSLAYWDNQ
ncbi:hypothetical protein C0992_005787 [Termitomyces sp. T32_za158]|nr:hypothetical protein C0992_005787 [Termitomyces sp. T32_za158]